MFDQASNHRNVEIKSSKDECGNVEFPKCYFIARSDTRMQVGTCAKSDIMKLGISLVINVK